MRPISNNNLVRVLSVGKKSGEESVKYEGVFDEYTDVEYTYTYDGVKEDIILEKYNGINKFDFELLTNGLELCEDKGCFCSKTITEMYKLLSVKLLCFLLIIKTTQWENTK